MHGSVRKSGLRSHSGPYASVTGNHPTLSVQAAGTTIFGTVRSVFERNVPASEARAVHRQLILMCITYLELVKASRSAPGTHEQTTGFGQRVA